MPGVLKRLKYLQAFAEGEGLAETSEYLRDAEAAYLHGEYERTAQLLEVAAGSFMENSQTDRYTDCYNLLSNVYFLYGTEI